MHAVRARVDGIFLLSFLMLCLASVGAVSARAATHSHLLTGYNDESDWSCLLEVSGEGVTFLQEDADFVDTSNDTTHEILYHVKRKAELCYTVQYLGSTGTDPVYHVSSGENVSEGDTYTQTVKLDRESQYKVHRGVDASISWKEITTDEDGHPVTNTVSKSCQFLPTVELWKPLNVIIENPFGQGSRRRIHSRMVTPAIVSTGTGNQKTITQNYSSLGHVNVKVVGLEGALIESITGWVTTDENGYADLRLLAPLDAEFNEGQLSGSVWIKAVKDSMELEGSQAINMYFALVKYANNVYYIQELGGELGLPLSSGDKINKGEHIQIGTTLGSGSLRLAFCNNQTVVVSADITEGFSAYIGGGELIEGANLLALDLRNKLQEFKDMPRRALRMQIYKELGGLLDSALGTPGGVGIVTQTPGAALEKLLTHYGERAYQARPPAPSSQSQQFLNTDYGLPQTTGNALAENTTQDAPISMNDAVRTDISFQTDGSIYLENMGGNVQLAMESGPSVNVIAGASVMVMTARGDQTNSLLSEVATSTTAWTAPLPAACLFSPTNGAILSTRTPAFTIDTNASPGLVVETAGLFLDGNQVTDWFDLESGPIAGQVPINQPLTVGFHELSFRCLTLKGDRLTQSITFQVAGDPPAPETVMATAFSNGVWLSWQTVPSASGYNVWRASSTNGVKTRLTPAPRQQPGFLDDTPLTTNVYWVATCDTLGQTRLPESPVSCLWSNGLPSVPAVSRPEDVSLAQTAQGVQLEFNDFDRDTTRWQLSRGSSSNGTFTVLETNEETLVSGYIDTGVPPGTNLYYQLTAMRLDGQGEAQSTTNIFTGTVPSAVTGLIGMGTNTAVQLGWDSYADFRATGLRVYGYDGDAFDLLASLPLTAVTYVDSQAAVSNRTLYQVRAVGASGESTPASVGVNRYEITTENAVISLPTEDIDVHEGDGVIMIPVMRTGNLGESASILYKVWHGNKGQAVEDVDFVKSAGTLTFDTNQTDAVIPVQLLTDSESEWAEGFSVDLGQGYGSTVAGTDWSADVVIEDSDRMLIADYNTEITEMETNGTIKIWIDRIWPSQHEVSVDVAVADPVGSAVAGTDYTSFSPCRVTFPAGVTRQYAEIQLLDDDVKDGTKVLNVTLQNPEGGASVDGDFHALAINIRDNDIHPGQLVFQVSGNILIALAGTNVVHIPVTRQGGTEGSIGAFVMDNGGTLPFGAVSFSAVSAADGESATTVTATLDRSDLDERIAPFCVVQMMNNEYPYDNDQVVLVFRHSGASTSPYAAWIAGYNDIGSETNATDNPDHDSAVNIEEYAMGTEPNTYSSVPSLAFSASSFSCSITNSVAPDPNLAVLGEFCGELLEGDWVDDAGWWMWNSDRQAYDTEFYKALGEETHQFCRLKFIWLGE